MPRDSEFAVLEMGMNAKGEIAALTRLVRPHIALVTTIASAHIEHLGSMEAITDAKAEIFEGMAKGGIAILNRDDGHFDRLSGHARRQGISRIIGFGRHEDAVARLLDYAADGDGGRISAASSGGKSTTPSAPPACIRPSTRSRCLPPSCPSTSMSTSPPRRWRRCRP